VTFRLSNRARADLERILRYSLEEHGRDAAARYELLLATSMKEIASLPLLRFSRAVKRRPGVRSYSITHSRQHVPTDQRVRNPAHQLVYRIAEDKIVEILAIVGDSYPAARVPLSKG
jgi:plasmid stabilization system protein ParE